MSINTSWKRRTMLALACGVVITASPLSAQVPPAPPVPGKIKTHKFTSGAAKKRTPVVSTRTKEKVHQLVDQIYESEVELSVQQRHSKILKMKMSIFRVAIADPTKIEVVAFGAQEVEVIGKETGTTTMTLWLGEEANPQILSVQVKVEGDNSIEDLRRMEYGEFQKMINEFFPNSKIQLIPFADKLIVRGQARDEQEATQIISIIRARSGSDANLGGGGGGSLFANGEAADPFPDGAILPESTVVDMLKVPGEKQVMLKVRIAQINRSAARTASSNLTVDSGEFGWRQIFTGTASSLAGGGTGLITGSFSTDEVNLVLSALAQNGYAKILAEPNLVTISGRAANFISGGEFAVPTVVGVGGAQAATTTFKGFGTQLSFLPTVLDKDRIRLQVTPTISTVNPALSVNGILGLNTQSASTTVDMREGQVFAIAGLIQEQQRGDLNRLPIIGDIPLIGPLFSNKGVTRNETELVILVSPELVHPMEAEDAPTVLPGMEVTEPGDWDFFFLNNIEGKPDVHHRSTVWYMQKKRMHRQQKDFVHQTKSDNYYINGDYGFSD
ncbi:MAG: pilus assembly protein N-terminal domain-containing protein [Planctomycetes bacterium]|nr:pilus assembly protein N-terminal domain-containing protein [Planctomycetota bacterium]MCH9724647.1 pilus assembly protein N-terminal domain-containing protein [Planctomycetota bacterium]MCH9777936.1 pilus assembly protein N-terminal domain-containing protein [Planctomycetota bacterium]MDF1746263.1 pilus assembly protein N-terminal domain-containing protein [Gimesia sp.]